MDFREGTALLARIDFNDDTYRMTTETDVDCLTKSIKRLGLIHPPILIEKAVDFSIVSGFRRIKACRNLGWSRIKGKILPENTPPTDCVRLAISENALHRKLNLVEQAGAFHMLHTVFRDDHRIVQEASLLGLPDNPAYIKKVQKIHGMPQPVQQGILSGSLSLPTALELNTMSRDTAVAFADLFNVLQISLNKQREIITFIREIAIREDISVLELLKSREIRNILEEDQSDRAHRARRVRAYLKQRRFPSLTKAEETLRAQIRQLKLGSGLSLKPPQHFEGTTYTLAMTFKNMPELLKRKEALDRAVKNPTFRRILGPADFTAKR